MTAPTVVCPKCKNEVRFTSIGNSRQCPICGFSYELAPPVVPYTPAESGSMSFLKLFVRLILIMAIVAIVGVAVVFVGCMYALRNM